MMLFFFFFGLFVFYAYEYDVMSSFLFFFCPCVGCMYIKKSTAWMVIHTRRF